MPMYLGPSGGLISFKAPKTMSIQSDDRSVYRKTAGGRVKEQRGPRTRRTWDISLNLATRNDVSQLLALTDGFYGPPPWVFVDSWAQVTNLLTRPVSLFAPGTWGSRLVEEFPDQYPAATLGGSEVMVDGLRAGRTLDVPVSGQVSIGRQAGVQEVVPVVAERSVTASLYIRGDVQLGLSWTGVTGNVIGTELSAPEASVDFTRRTITAAPPAGAAGCHLRVSSAGTPVSLALPAITWTRDAGQWSPGNGCNTVTVDGLAEAVQYAVADVPHLRRSSVSFTVQELG